MKHKIACLTCGKQTPNPKFCSRSCAAQHNNHVYPKRIGKLLYCNECGEEIVSGGRNWVKRKYCNKCRFSSIQQKTISDIKSSSGYAYSIRVNDNARTVLKKSGVQPICKACGYTKHVETCHIKPVRTFDEDSTIAEVNALDNLMYLCPNCHWEFDNGLLTL